MKNQNLLHRFPEFAEALQELKTELKQAHRPADEILLDDVDLREMLKISKRTLATYRQQRLIKHSWLQGKCFYKLSDVLDTIERNAVNPILNQLRIKL